MKTIRIIPLFAALFFAACGGAQTEAYCLKVDGRRVEVTDCRVSAVPINQVWPGYQRPADQTDTAYFAAWEMPQGPVEVEITADREVGTVRVTPASAGIEPRVSGRRIRFTLDAPRNLSVEVDGTHRALHLFASPVSEEVPRDGEPGVRYYGPGYHEAGIVRLESGERVYVAPGAVVSGGFYAVNARDITISGRGVIDQSRYERGSGSVVGFSGCRNVKVEGVILCDASMWCCTFFGCDSVEVDNVKIVGQWRYNSDGIDVVNSSRVRVRNCFVRSFDDALVVKGMKRNLGEPEPIEIGHLPVEDVLFENCTVWCDWGHALEIGAETCAPSIRNVVYRGIDIVRTSFVAMSILHGDGAPVRDILYEDIRLNIDPHTPSPVFQTSRGEVYEDAGGFVPMLFEAIINKDMLWAQDELAGDVEGVTYRNVSVTGPEPTSLVKGLDAEHRIRGLVVENLRFNGEPVRDAVRAGIVIEQHADPVTFR